MEIVAYNIQQSVEQSESTYRHA